MKHLLFPSLLFIVLFSACSVQKPNTNSIVFVDYRPYSEKGFFITESNSVNFEYRPIGSIIAYVEAGFVIVSVDNKTSKKIDDVYDTNRRTLYTSATPQKAMEELYTKAVSMGANAIINLSIKPISTSGTVNGYSATGMAVQNLRTVVAQPLPNK